MPIAKPSPLMLVAVVLLFRPDFFMDQVAPEYQRVPAAQVFDVAGKVGADDRVVIDGNHPLAGTALVFSCTVAEVRKASTEELTHGHVHGEHGHQH